MKCSVVLAVFLLTIIKCESQSAAIYQADPKFYNDGTQAAGFCFLRKLIDNEVYDYDKKKYTITSPASFKTSDIAWGLSYFSGLEKNTTRHNLFFLLADYDSSFCRIVFDKNGNADLSDDSIYTIEKGKWFKTTLTNRGDPQAKAVFSFFYEPKFRDSMFLNLYKGHNARHADGISAFHIISDQRNNFRKVVLPDSNIVTLYDFNVNGFFDDKEDKVIAGDVHTHQRIIENPVKTKQVSKGAELIFANNTYELVSVDKYGNSVSLIPLNTIRDSTEQLPSFSFTDSANKKQHFRPTHQKKFTVLYFWGNWCMGCHIQAPYFVKLLQDYPAQLDYYTFNTGDKEETMRNYISKKNYPFQYNRIDNKNIDKLHVEAFPFYIVTDPDNRIVFRSPSIDELNNFFTKNKMTR